MNRVNLPSKVAKFDNVGVGIKKQILRFDVSVANAHFVNIREGTSNWKDIRVRRCAGIF